VKKQISSTVYDPESFLKSWDLIVVTVRVARCESSRRPVGQTENALGRYNIVGDHEAMVGVFSDMTMHSLYCTRCLEV